MYKTLAKNIRRLILSTKSRFFALTAIVTIGVAFFVGVSATSPIMGHSVDDYDDETHMKDITVYSNYGFDQADIDAIGKVPEVELCEGAWFADVIASYESASVVTRIHSWSPDQQINRFVLVDGRLPENEHEALSENGTTLEGGFPIGAKVEFSYPEGISNDSLLIDEVTIVGTIDTPLYMNITKENSTLNNMYIDTYLYVPEKAFDTEFYLEANVLLKQGAQKYTFSDDYYDYADSVKKEIETLARTQKDARINRIKEDAMKEYEDGLKKYLDGLKEYNDKIADGEQQIADAEQQIADGQAKIDDGWRQYYDGENTLNKEIADGLAKLQEAERLVAEGKLEYEKGKADFEKQKAELQEKIIEIDDGIAKLKEAKKSVEALLGDTLLHEDDPADDLLAYAPELKALLEELGIADDITVGEVKAALDGALIAMEGAEIVLKNLPEDLRRIPIKDLEKMMNEDFLTLMKAVIDVLGLDTSATVEEVMQAAEDRIPETVRKMKIKEIEVFLPEQQAQIVKELTDALGLDENATVNELLIKADETIPEAIRNLSVDECEQFIKDDVIGGISYVIELAGLDENATVDELIEALDAEKKELQAADEMLEKMLTEVITEDTKLELFMQDDDMKELVTSMGLDENNTVGELLKKIDDTITELQNTRQMIIDGIAEGERQLQEAEARLIDGEKEIADGYDTLEKETASARDKLYDARNELIKAQNELNAALNDLAAAKKELEEGRISGWEELEDARIKLEDAKKEIDDLKAGEWTVLDRTQHYATATFQNTVDQMKAIANIFPVFFILVAALVCLTTMTRLVDEQRSEIGTLRALGYTEMQCAGKYLIYAGAATLLGEVLGIIAGMLIFPIVIYTTWGMLYIMPPIHLKMQWGQVLVSTVSFLAGMLLTTWYACRQDMKEVPSQLMRPKAPKVGKATLIEKIPFIWERLTFTWKVTMRNLFRYKRRFFMTVAGVAGCGALLVTGFGIRDSINAMVDIQFYEIYQCQGTIGLDPDLSEEETDDFIKSLLKRSDIDDVTPLHTYSAKAAGDDTKINETAGVEVYADARDIDAVYKLRTMDKHEPLVLDDDGVIINIRLAENLNLSVGDTIAMEGADGSFADVPVSGITEMYVNHYIFMTENLYRQYFDDSFGEPTLQVKVNGSEEDQKITEAQLANLPQVETVGFYTELLENFRNMIKGLNYVVWTLIVSSMSLAFVVLGNLINVNISERQREIATLKVLGFRKKEVESYIYKENNILTMIGAVVALPIGTWLHHYIMGTVEMDYVIFGRKVFPLSYVYAIGLTLLFGVMVNHFMAGKLEQIEMVESLKSVE